MRATQIFVYTVSLAIASFSIFFPAKGVSQQAIYLWQKGKMPNSRQLVFSDSSANERIYRIREPRMHAFFTSADDNSGTAVLILPGGGYSHLTTNLGGFQLAKWLNSIGINAFVLEYRLPGSADVIEPPLAPLQDAQRALKMIRYNSVRWHLDASRIGVMGTSAGGHLAALLGTENQDLTGVNDSLRLVSFRPDFMILISPLIDLDDSANKESARQFLGKENSPAQMGKYSAQNRVTSQTPPCFIVQALNDAVVPPHHSVLFLEGLLKNNVSCSFHLFPFGAHKIGANNNPGSTGQWKQLCEAWLTEMELVK